MRIIISGACGHMGRAVAEAAAAAGVPVAAGVDPCGGAAAFPVYSGFDALPDLPGCVIIDFSAPDSLPDLLAYAEKNRLPAVLATTGYTPAQLDAIDAAAKRLPLFRSANMSLGIALLKALSAQAAGILGEGWDIEIVEAHHRRKADAPSGTALLLYDAIREAAGGDRPAVYGRQGRQKRNPGEIGIHALRGGTVVGEHQVCFLGEHERVILSHSAESRSVFAAGALRAAAFLEGRAPGCYSMDQLVADLLRK